MNESGRYTVNSMSPKTPNREDTSGSEKTEPEAGKTKNGTAKNAAKNAAEKTAAEKTTAEKTAAEKTTAKKTTAKKTNEAVKKDAGSGAPAHPHDGNIPEMTTEEAVEIIGELDHLYPHTPAEKNFLKFDNPFQILIMTILSAQTTDATVNSIRGELFRTYPTPADLAGADVSDVERIIHPAGFYHAKTRNIMKTSERLCTAYGGEVPADMNELTTLSGVGRKTANIVLEHAFGITVGIAVDTHVGRLSKKLGFTENTDPVKAEKDLMALFPEEWWGEINYLLIRHGREVCQAKKPDCVHCAVREHCRDFMNRENYNRRQMFYTRATLPLIEY